MRIVKYLPENYQPELFGNSPTSVFDAPLKEVLNRNADAIAQIIKPHNLTVGSEIEMLLFHEDYDPRIHRRYDFDHNPNYSHYYDNRQDRFFTEIYRRGIGELLWEVEPVTKYHCFSEFRTRPNDLAQQAVLIDNFCDIVAISASTHGLLPIVHSQHTHIVWGQKISNIMLQSAQDIMARCRPLLALPSEIHPRRSSRKRLDLHTGAKRNFIAEQRGNKGHPSLEFRLLSSEYAWNPTLNLAIVSSAIRRGLETWFEIDSPEQAPRFIQDYSLKVKGGFKGLAKELPQDVQLKQGFPLPVLEGLSRIIVHYPQIESGKKTVSDITNFAHSLVQEK